MKSVVLLVVLILGIACSRSETEVRPAPEIRWMGIEAGLDAANGSDKKVLVNIYTDWCNFCKKMTDTVYPDSLVRQSVYEHFIPVGLNAESDALVTYQGSDISERDLARKLGVRSYPTMLFMNAQGELILQSNGYMPAQDFNRMLLYIGSNAYQSMEFIQFEPDRHTAKR